MKHRKRFCVFTALAMLCGGMPNAIGASSAVTYSYKFNTYATCWYDLDLDGTLEYPYSNNGRGFVKIDYGVKNSFVKVDGLPSAITYENNHFENINGDDYVDIVIPEIGVYKGTADLKFDELYVLNTTSRAMSPIDYDNDGLIDIIERNRTDADIIIPNVVSFGHKGSPIHAKIDVMSLNEYLGIEDKRNSSGTGIPSITDAMVVPNVEPTDPACFASFSLCDITGDGLPDMIDSKYGKVYYNVGNGRWVITDFGGKIMTRDLNNDHILDYIIYNDQAKTITSYILQKNGSPKEQKLMSGLYCGENIWCYDFDKDNDVDILMPLNYSENKASYLLLMENKGDGSFKKHETYIEELVDFVECVDYDSDGNYEVIAKCKTDSDNIVDVCSYKVKGTEVSTSPDWIYHNLTKNSSISSVSLMVADVNNSGIMNVIYDKLMIPLSDMANQRPTAPNTPEYIFDSTTGLLKISWDRGSDAETHSMDLTYALRIGSEPDKGDYLFAHALADGSRRNLRAGNQGYSMQRIIDVSSWPVGKYYISVQSVDPNRRGSKFSEYAIFEKKEPENDFVLSYKNPFAVHDTCTVSLKGKPVTGNIYNWDFDGADVLSSSEDGSTYQITFRSPGKKCISLQSITASGVMSSKKEHVLSVDYANVKKCPVVVDEVLRTSFRSNCALDIDEDGIVEVFNYTVNGKFYKSNTDGSFTSIKKIWNTNANNRFYSSPGTIDKNNDGLCDVLDFKTGVLYQAINLGDNEMEIMDPVSISSPYYLEHYEDIDNNGIYDGIYDDYLWKNEGDYMSFIKIESVYNGVDIIIDYNRDGLVDFISQRYAFINQGDFTFERKLLFEESRGSLVSVVDFDNDGCYDFLFKVGHSDVEYIIKWGNDGTDNVVTDEINGDASVFDMDNNGYYDICIKPYDSEADNSKKIIYFFPNREFKIVPLSTEDSDLDVFEEDMIPFERADGKIMFIGSVNGITGRNERPAAPTGLRSRQFDNSVVLEWNPSIDKETAACNMQYNLSVKRKGATGEGSYLFSPCNSTKNGVPVPTHKPLISSTVFTIPIANIPAGEYEVQVQGVDAWRKTSDFSEVYNLVVKETATLQMWTSTGVGVKTLATVSGNTIPVINWGEAEVEKLSDKSYYLTWDTPGTKTVTVDGEAYEIYVNPLPEGNFTLPETVIANAIVSVEGTNMNIGKWEVSTDNGSGYTDINESTSVVMTVIDDKHVSVTFLDAGEYALCHTVESEYNTAKYMASTVVTDVSTTQEIDIVTVDYESGKHVVRWSESCVPAGAVSVNIYKETSRVNEYRLIDNVALGTGSYIDLSSTPEASASRYRLSYVLSYGESELSTAHQSMHLMINKGMDSAWNLMWSRYEGMDVTSYRILRGTSPDNLIMIAEVSGNMSSYSDVDAPETTMLYYAVEVVASSTIAPMSVAQSSAMSSQSNVVSIANAPNVKFVTAIDIDTADGGAAEINSPDSLSLKLTAYVYPSLATMQRVNWIVYSGEDIATIDQTGKLTAKGDANGTVVVRAYAVDGSGVYGEVAVTVLNMSGVETGYLDGDTIGVLNVYPSPADSGITIEGMVRDEDTEVYVFGVSGEIVYRTTTTLDCISVNCSGFAPGIYFVKAQSATTSMTARFIKQ